MRSRSVSVRLPDDLYEKVNSLSGSNFSEKLIALLRMYPDMDEYMGTRVKVLEQLLKESSLRFMNIRNLLACLFPFCEDYFEFGYSDERDRLVDLLRQIPACEGSGAVVKRSVE